MERKSLKDVPLLSKGKKNHFQLPSLMFFDLSLKGFVDCERRCHALGQSLTNSAYTLLAEYLWYSCIAGDARSNSDASIFSAETTRKGCSRGSWSGNPSYHLLPAMAPAPYNSQTNAQLIPSKSHTNRILHSWFVGQGGEGRTYK